MHEFSGSLSLSLRSIAHSSTAQAAPTASPIFLARSPEPATDYDYSGLTTFNPVGLTSLNPVGDSGIYLLRTGELRAPSSSIKGVGLGRLVPLAENTDLGRLVPRTEHAALGRPPLTSTAFHDFRTHEPRIRIDGLSASPGRFVARGSASVATTEGCTGRESISPAADTVFDSVFTKPIEGGTGSAEALAAATPIAQPTPLSRSSTEETDAAATAGFTVSVFALLGTPAPPSSTTRQRTAKATGNAPPLSIVDSGPAGPLDHLPDEVQPHRESHGRGRLRPPPRSLPNRRPARCHFRPTATTQSLWELLSYGSRLLLVTRRLHIQGRTPSATLLDCGSLIPSRIIRMPIRSESSMLSRRATP